MKPIQYIDIFAGCGGLSLGLHKSGIDGLFAIEKNEDAFATLKYNLIDGKKHFSWVNWLPMKAYDINDLLLNYRNQLEQLHGQISLIAGGPPCQGFSLAGKRDVHDIRNKLIHSYLDFVEIVSPEAVFFENVHGITCSFENENEKTLPYSKIIEEELRILGYKIDSKIINMADYGVPQNRHRFILVGFKNHDPGIFFNQLNAGRVDFLKRKNLPYGRQVSTEDAINDLRQVYGVVECPDSKGFLSGIYGPLESSYQRVMRGVHSKRSEGCIPNSHRFTKHKMQTVKVNSQILEKYEKGQRITQENSVLADFKKRGVTYLNESLPSPTVTSHPDDFLHYSEPRILTVRELARLQSFPDWFEFKGNYTTGGLRRKNEVPRFTQVGNAIPPLFAEQVGLVLKEILDD